MMCSYAFMDFDVYSDKIQSLDTNLDSESKKALEDLLDKVSAFLPTEKGQCTTADAQGTVHYWLLAIHALYV